MLWIFKIILCVLAIKDIKTQKVENYITYPLIIVAFITGLCFYGFRRTVVCMLFSFVIWSAIFFFKAIGGADVKIMTALGCLILPLQNMKLMAVSIWLAAFTGGGILIIDYIRKGIFDSGRKMAFVPCIALATFICGL